MKTFLAAAGILVAVASHAVAQQANQQAQAACRGDAQKLCSQHLPDRARVRGCLIEKIDQVSSGCRAAIAAATQ
ncbi:hypothetical protein [Polymorphum gilvum]|uniref:Cysteine rich repeat domain protein n=1 Tax=Polymorphum gilvum (strain LMG 25793 / CGMCC 1.9160 / SL003B-26A1) TaxID=991905 RepID=F2IY47_POLGS|nr:hypothetical protein [Polymorphum gilvum]ADZ70549.1 hypothetical protein SL003B_2125 [Polymorphum gilvum SL003B-26A1]